MNDPQPQPSSQRIGRNLLLASLAGAWASFCLLLPRLGYSLLDAPLRAHMLEIVDTLGIALAKHLSLPSLPPWPLQALLVFAAVALVALLWLRVLHWLDRDHGARHALRWSLGTLPMLLLWCLGLGLVSGAIMLADARLGSHAVWSLAILLIYLLSLPFFCLRREPIASDRPPLAWLPSLPGWPAASVIGACVLLILVAAMAEGALGSSPGAVVLVSAAVWLLHSFALATVTLVWLRRSDWKHLATDMRDAWRWFRLRRVLAVRWRLDGLFALFVAPLLFAIALDAIFFQPELVRAIDALQLARPSVLMRWVEMTDTLMQWWWPGLSLIVLWLSLTACARTLLQTEGNGRLDGS